VLSSCGLPLPPTCLLVTVNEARCYFASTILELRNPRVSELAHVVSGKGTGLSDVKSATPAFDICAFDGQFSEHYLLALSLLGHERVVLLHSPRYLRWMISWPAAADIRYWIALKSKSHYSWQSANQSVLVSSSFWGSWPDVTYVTGLTLTVSVSWDAPFDEGAGLSFVWSLSLSFVKYVQFYICITTMHY
jgi:hypothetical protein